MNTLKRMIVPGTRGSNDDHQQNNSRSGEFAISVRNRIFTHNSTLETAAPPPLPSRPPARPMTPLGGNPFDAIQKPPSITMEKIKQQQTATLNRMSMLQQRYRQSQLNLHAASLADGAPADRMGLQGMDAEQKRRVSSASQVDLRAFVSCRSVEVLSSMIDKRNAI